jgi:hypothetical protein
LVKRYYFTKSADIGFAFFPPTTSPPDKRITGGTDGSAWPSATRTNDSIQGNPGGIDFRNLPIVTQAIGNLRSSLGTVPLARLEKLKAGTVPLEQEWQEIERLVNSGITPSTERIKEFIQAAAIRSDTDSDMSTVVSCIADIFRLEEERCEHADPVLKDILIVLESGRSSQELKEVFVDI